MSFYAIGEPEYGRSNWYANTLNGLIQELRKKRLTLTFLDNVTELEHHTIEEDDAIFLIGTNTKWLRKIIQACEPVFQNRVIVLSNINYDKKLYMGKFSIVTTDTTHDIQLLYNYLISYGKNRIALYGINPSSASDLFRKECFLSYNTSEEDVFYNSVSLSQCFEDFRQKLDLYDAVICANDYSAISLTKHLEDQKQIFITSCGGSTLLLNFFSPRITHTRIDYQSIGKAGFDLYNILKRNRNANSISIYISSCFSAGETTDYLPLSGKYVPETRSFLKENENFYSDPEVSEILKIDTLLNACDGNDFQILERLLNHVTYAQIAEELFMSTNGVKYKIKKMFQICQVASRQEFVTLLKKYLAADSDSFPH